MWQKNFPLAKWNLGSALVDFFDLYSRKFNFVNLSIRVRDGGGYVQKKQLYSRDANQMDLLSIEDPQDSSNELCRNGYAIPNVRRAFQHAYGILSKWHARTSGSFPSPLSCILRVDKLIWDRKNYVLLEQEAGVRS
mmetsp:Transcript_15865/g.39288  ORF Transcript_15865/g.39288 Transcript_15865/m.39288 type:complete len:136 (+) Transcript_15865:288-695(+)